MRVAREPHESDAARLPPLEVFQAGLRNHHVSNTAYPIAHATTWRPYRVPSSEAPGVAARAWDGVRDLGLYVHVPFCETRCSFCEYTVVRRDELPRHRAYFASLEREIRLWLDALDGTPRVAHGLDFGGGTPGLAEPEDLARILELLRASFRFAPGSDVSIETTPKIAAQEPGRVRAWREAGIDRASMGIQVVEPDLLRVLNREENGASAHRAAMDHLREAGFTRVNVDLMYGFAGQSPASWRATLDHAVALGPEAITLYRMRYKLTRISHQAREVELPQVRELARLAKRVLADAGYHANPGKTTWSRDPADVGTSSYLARRVADMLPYLGFGLGAQSFSPTTITYNDGAAGKNLEPHRASVERGRLPVQDAYDLPPAHLMGKACAVSFYFGEIDEAAFRARFGVALGDAFPAELDFVLSRGLMERARGRLRLTPEGADHVNGVIALFFAPSIQRYLVERDPDAAVDFVRSRRAALAVAGEAARG